MGSTFRASCALAVCEQFERSHSDGRSSVLLDAGTALLARVAADWGCEDVVLRNFLVQIDALYQKQPYHNAKHGTLVSSTCFHSFPNYEPPFEFWEPCN